MKPGESENNIVFQTHNMEVDLLGDHFDVGEESADMFDI